MRGEIKRLEIGTGKNKVWSERVERIDGTQLKAIPNRMDFKRGQFEKSMEEYSGGQKKKVLTAAGLREQANLYVRDEPLNFIDVYSRVRIERLILTYEQTMIFVEHDKTFRERVATQFVHLENRCADR